MRSAHMKRILKLDRLRLRGLSGAKDEVLLYRTAQNLRFSSSSSAVRRLRLRSPVRRSRSAKRRSRCQTVSAQNVPSRPILKSRPTAKAQPGFATQSFLKATAPPCCIM